MGKRGQASGSDCSRALSPFSSKFKKLPLLGILRGIKPGELEPLTATIIESGLQTIEITMNTSGASGLLKKTVQLAGKKLMIGAGTVLTLDELKLAIDSGATFIVMPVLVENVVKYCVKKKTPVFPGAFTPFEIYKAWQAGATMVKVFPAQSAGGPDYFKEVKGPFNHIELLACGGITPDNLSSYFENGASAIAFGGSVFRKDWLREKNFKKSGEAIKELIDAYRNIAAKK
ncbi:MAG: hypothetical protein A3G33_02475 [Omnitrophica bacterium RIFCSPLOWO2_12_FULL_44_17]|uniref:2-dehydro-3-deoxyphosphogluconate aldolase n=1 Tax=Candidatus Danuiimicrobium aquiferis TaxID=1801832 RepID=A0A1G1KX10_9BACT|nr:MAG: hypothetical protein A3B72_00360 [Omnitrophica bacterium RIFCSPHIGHO2_02_FULL_45_28]OGW88865.1 MAG: hypothetical protein A3E74_00185 [Omnitrophica bacterium RIFCSPHIGHO2_12_FULL_44_12]OGW97129.1 MAG: hypothetical protein A3G33_02475 [Omnitrophica bacterium RIFCSPLOWO2_12_FULL_44_17]OGX03880.1 MAG: hypothetical protein A3J12_02345 [Omnitrophica bacterium RIFCSPLOWO2_02_FULL_44_11]